MSLTRSTLLIVLACCTAVSAQSTQPALTESDRDALMRELAELRQKVERLEAQQQQQQTIDQRVVDETVQRVIADAQQRSQVISMEPAVSLTGGFDDEKRRFFLRSADGNFLLMPGFLTQIRYTANWNQGAEPDGDDQTETGWEIRRMRMFFEGNVFTPDLMYKFQFETNSEGGGVFLQDAWIRYRFATNWAFQIGQFKDIPYHEESTLDQYLLAADRSFINALIGGGQTERTQGVMLMYDDRDHWRGQLLFGDGYNTDNTDFTDTSGGTTFIGVTPTDFGFSGRLEYFASGKRQSYDQFTALGNKEDLLVFGGGFDWSQGDGGNVIFQTVDVQWENTHGFGLYGAWLGTWQDITSTRTAPPGLPPEGNFYNWGFLVQGSYLFTEKLEGFARYDYTFLDDDAINGSDGDVQEITVGINYYFKLQNVRMTIDATWLPDGSPINLKGLGILAGDENQFIIRGQFQLLL